MQNNTAAPAATIDELTDRLVAASDEWDENTGDEPTSRPYLEYLARAVATSGYTLAKYAELLAVQRDRHQAAYDEYGDRTDLGYVGGFKLALSFLHIHTNGEYGQSRGEQPGGAA